MLISQGHIRRRIIRWALLLGLGMGVSMIAGTYVAKHYIKNMEKGKFQKYVAILLCIVGGYMAIVGAG